jgi:hypothetical protein
MTNQRMSAKQYIAIAKNNRLNYLIDSNLLTAEEIVIELGRKVNLKFVEGIIVKRKREGFCV